MNRQMSGNSTDPVDKDAEIAFLRAELQRVTGGAEIPTRTYYWVGTMRGEQPRCRNCDGPLTRGPKGGVTDSICPQCGAELRANATPSMERR